MTKYVKVMTTLGLVSEEDVHTAKRVISIYLNRHYVGATSALEKHMLNRVMLTLQNGEPLLLCIGFAIMLVELRKRVGENAKNMRVAEIKRECRKVHTFVTFFVHLHLHESQRTLNTTLLPVSRGLYQKLVSQASDAYKLSGDELLN